MKKTYKNILTVLEQYWNARKMCYKEGQSGITKAKYELYEMMDDLFGRFEEDPYHKTYDEIRKKKQDDIKR